MWENADMSFSSLPTPEALLHLHPCLSLNLSFFLIYIMDGSFSLHDQVNT